MAKRAKQSFIAVVNGQSVTVSPKMIFANSHALTSTYSSLFETISEISASALPTPTVTVDEGTVTDTEATVNWTASANASSYTVTTTPATSTYNTSALTVDLTGLAPETGYTVSVVAKGGPLAANSTAGTDTLTTDA